MDNLKHGRWVATDKGVGILQREREPDNGFRWDVHLTDDKGDTRLIVPLSACASVRQANVAELPDTRVPNKADPRIAALGYR